MARDRRQTASIPKRGQLPTSNSTDIAAANIRCASALASVLVENGIRHVVVSSGSRCAPLVIAAAYNVNLQLWTNPDERSAGFLALGAAKATGQPAALICTSGTAAANYFPAIIESSMAGVPLVVITADRPPSLRRTGAPQTINQVRLYGDQVLLFEDMVVPGSRLDDAAEWMSVTHRAVGLARSAGGPVHINTPFAEPLLTDRESIAAIIASAADVLPGESPATVARGISDSIGHSLREIGQLLNSAKRPVIVCGPNAHGSDLAQSVVMLAERIGAPILADIASQLRGSKEVISHYDFILRDEEVRAKLAPDVILRLGALPTSKALNEWIVSSPAKAKIGIADGVVADPGRILTHSFRANCQDSLRLLMDVVSTRLDFSPAYRNMWKGVDGTVATLLEGSPAEPAELLECGIVSRVCSHIGNDTNLFLSNSMPIRWADMYAKARDGFPPVFVNRGANGIDGIVSTAAGVARASRRTTICVLGDLTFLHDQNGLWQLADDQVPLKIILLNNSGGGVFHFLPIASHDEHFERLVAMPHNIDLAQLASAHGIRYWRSQSPREFSIDFEECLRHSGPAVLEVHTDRTLNHKRHMEIVATVTRATRESLRIL